MSWQLHIALPEAEISEKLLFGYKSSFAEMPFIKMWSREDMWSSE